MSIPEEIEREGGEERRNPAANNLYHMRSIQFEFYGWSRVQNVIVCWHWQQRTNCTELNNCLAVACQTASGKIHFIWDHVNKKKFSLFAEAIKSDDKNWLILCAAKYGLDASISAQTFVLMSVAMWFPFLASPFIRWRDLWRRCAIYGTRRFQIPIRRDVTSTRSHRKPVKETSSRQLPSPLHIPVQGLYSFQEHPIRSKCVSFVWVKVCFSFISVWWIALVDAQMSKQVMRWVGLSAMQWNEKW